MADLADERHIPCTVRCLHVVHQLSLVGKRQRADLAAQTLRFGRHQMNVLDVNLAMVGRLEVAEAVPADRLEVMESNLSNRSLTPINPRLIG